MAAEITFTPKFTILKGNLNVTRSLTGTFDVAAAAPGYASGAPSIGTTEEALVMQDVATAGWAYFRNLNATNYIQIGALASAVFVPVLKLMPGEFCWVRLGTNAPYAKANTAACLLEYQIFEA